MATSANILQAVATYQKSGLARLVNMFAGIAKANKKFQNFQDMTAQLGNTVTYDTPPRAFANPGLVVSSFDTVEQRVNTLTVGGFDIAGNPLNGGYYDSFGNLNAANCNFAVSSEQLVFNIDNNDYRKVFEESMMVELGTIIERSILNRFINDTYRFYTAGVDTVSKLVNPINSFAQLAFAESKFKDYGCPSKGDYEAFVPNMAVSGIIATGQNKFTPMANDRRFNSWELGVFDTFNYNRSNLLPVHISGTMGINQDLLTVTSFVTNADGGITNITFSGASTNNAGAALKGDLGYFVHGVAGQPDLSYLTFTGHAVSEVDVQFQVTADATSAGGNVTLNIFPALYSAPGKNQNINAPIAVGMQVLLMPSHRAGVMYAGSPFYLAMPQLPDQAPFITSSVADADSGAAIRLTTGSAFGQNLTGSIVDSIWGAKLTPEYGMRLLFPVNTGFSS